MERILLFGGSGILGTEVLGLLQKEKMEYVAPRSSDLDIRSRNLVSDLVQEFKPTWIINCAAWTNVDGAETSYEYACDLNEVAVENMALAAEALGCKVIHISTDYVFDGESETPYKEDSLVNPVNKYGESKLRGEQALMAVLPGSFVVRTSWLYGVTGKNFVKTIVGKALRNEPTRVVDDQVGSPTSSRDLASAVVSIIRNQPHPGIYNFSNEGRCTWFDLAFAIYESVGADPQLVQAIDSNSLNSKAKRPKFSVLNKDKWKLAHLSQVPEWRSSLESVLPEIVMELKQQGEA
jgi:dTDP-4-dehydrorhamnose reductase